MHVRPPQPWAVPPPGHSQIPRQEPTLLPQHVHYQTQPQHFQAFIAPKPITVQNTTTEANLLGDFDFSSPQSCAVTYTNSSSQALQNSTPVQSHPAPSSSHTTPPPQEKPQYQ